MNSAAMLPLPWPVLAKQASSATRAHLPPLAHRYDFAWSGSRRA